MAHLSHKLNNSFEGALAGGGDPATSPLYVFGPFLKLIMAAGVAQIAFGGSVWLAVITILVVSAVYRMVMQWVTDGSGGSGLSEEEFGGWAVKVNAAITFIEYTLTFLVSMSAMVTFIADRFPFLNEAFLGVQYRTLAAVLLSVFTGWLVNRGPKIAARTFGPATASVLLLLWLMIFATIFKLGLHLPQISLQAFTPPYLHFTIGGYVRILAVMTGIEVFANLVAAYGGTPAEKGRKAFGSLLIVMGTTAATMLVVGPAIFALTNPDNAQVSVFTQAMDLLLPDPLPYLGSLVGIFVLMSASAASAQGLQNLALGLKERHYIPNALGARNQYDVADKPVWLEVGVVCVCFLLLGTREETYLSLYAVGVFVLLSMTCWAVMKRLVREVRKKSSPSKWGLIAGTVIAALLTTGATLVIFEERFLEGAWAYFLFIPLLYAAFTYTRIRIGVPSPEMDYLGHIDSNLLAGFGFGQSEPPEPGTFSGERVPMQFTWMPETTHVDGMSDSPTTLAGIHHVLTLLDGSTNAAQAIPMAQYICKATGARLTMLTARSENKNEPGWEVDMERYLLAMAQNVQAAGVEVDCVVRSGSPAVITQALVLELGIDLVVITKRGESDEKNWRNDGLSSKLIHLLDIPVVLVQPFEHPSQEMPDVCRILVPLDGSRFSEQALLYARLWGRLLDSEILLLAVPAIPESDTVSAPDVVIQTIRKQAEENMRKYLEFTANKIRKDGLRVDCLVTGSSPAQTIVDVSIRENVDLIILTSQGRGGLNLLMTGSVTQQVVDLTDTPAFVLPINHEN